ncbi:unnamed protein product, partial [marine sediment metagenome]
LDGTIVSTACSDELSSFEDDLEDFEEYGDRLRG